MTPACKASLENVADYLGNACDEIGAARDALERTITYDNHDQRWVGASEELDTLLLKVASVRDFYRGMVRDDRL